MFETYEERRDRLNREEREAHRKWRRRKRFSNGTALGGLLAGTFVTAIFAGTYAVARRVELGAVRSELPDQLKTMVIAQRSFEAANGRYLSIGDPSDAYAAMEAGRAYVPIEGLGASGDGLRGAYWVILREGGFEAHGLLDADGDGLPAHWVATESRPPYPITDDGVY